MRSASTLLGPQEKGNEKSTSTRLGWTVASISILLLVAFLAHLYRIDFQSFWWDETLSAQRARGDLAYILSNKIMLFTDVTIDQHPPLYFLLLHFASIAFGTSEFALRYLSAGLILLAIPLSYQTGRALDGKVAGLMVGLAAAVSPFYLWFAQDARPYALVVPLATLSNYLFIRLIKRMSIKLISSYLVVLAALLAANYPTLILFFAQMACFLGLAILDSRLRLRAAIIGSSALALAMIVGVPYAISRYLILPTSPHWASIGSGLSGMLASFLLGMSRAQLTYLPFALLVAGVGLGGAVIGALRTRGKPIGAIWVFAIMSAGLIFFILQYKSIYEVRYVTFLAPAFYLLLGYGYKQIGQLHISVMVMLALTIAAMGLIGSYDALMVDNNGKQDFRAVARYIAEHGQEGDGIILDGKKIVTAFEYYPPGAYPLYGIPDFPTTDREVISRQLSDVAEQHPRLWFVNELSGDIDPEGLVDATLKTRFQQIDEHDVVGSDYSIGLKLFATRPMTLNSLPENTQKVDINFDNRLTLVGYRITRAANQEKVVSVQSQVAMPDAKQKVFLPLVTANSRSEAFTRNRLNSLLTENRFNLTLYWQVTRASLPRLAMFGQLVDAGGNSWGAFDAEPYNGFVSTDRWAEGTIIADRRELWVPPGTPPGTYSLRVGVRSAVSPDRPLAVRDAAGGVQNEVAMLANAVDLGQVVDGDDKSLILPMRVNATFENGLRLLGGDDLNRTLSAGQDISLRLFWQNQKGLDRDVGVEFWLANERGQYLRIAELPISNGLANESWPVGKVVGAYYQLRLPPDIDPGQYQIAIKAIDQQANRILGARIGLNPFPRDLIYLARVDISATDRKFELPESLYPVEANLGDQIELAGLDPVASASIKFSSEPPGVPMIEIDAPTLQPIPINLWWKVLAPVQKDYVVFVQVLNEDDVLVDQHDGIAVSGSRPTVSWKQGEAIEDSHPLGRTGQLPPGKYSIIVGMYDRKTGGRLQLARKNGDYVKIADLVVR